MSEQAAPTAGGVPRVVIVGRPNVGKSSLFNAMAGRRVAIEDPMAGVTRDRVSFVLGVGDCEIELVDTGGMGLVDETRLREHIDRQISIALESAHLVLFVVDAKAGVTPVDREIAARLRRLPQPVKLIANKVEGRLDAAGVGEAYSLGLGEPHEVSAKERIGVTDLVDDVVAALGDVAVAPQVPSDVIRLSIVGRMNVGKSTLVNALVEDDRVIVSDLPGTTRDAVDVPFQFLGRRFIAVDTAGLRKRKTVSDSVEFYSQSRALRAIRRASVALLMIDATRDIGRIDRQIAAMIVEESVPAVIVVSKWDLARERALPGDYEPYVRQRLPNLPHAPIAFVAAIERLNLEGTLQMALELHDQAGQRVPTGEINCVVQRAWTVRKPKPDHGRIGKIYYATQVDTHPPTLKLFVNEPALFDDSWRRFLMHELQRELPFHDIPVRLEFAPRGGAPDARD